MTDDSDLSGPELLNFVEHKMNMTSYYQPVIIAALIDAGGSLTKHELAQVLLVADGDTVARAERTLMRWPKTTLSKHQVIHYERSTSTFTLRTRFRSDGERAAVLAACAERLAAWNRQASPATASARYAAIEAAGGRCQACGIAGSERPLDVDHIRPRSSARRGKVKDGAGGWIPVDARDNLQVLCSKCNRGKRDAGEFDFRPREERLVETIRITLQLAESLGLDPNDVAGVALDDFNSK